MTMTDNQLQDGRVVGIAGPVIDVEFPPDALPEINTALSFEVIWSRPNVGGKLHQMGRASNPHCC